MLLLKKTQQIVDLLLIVSDGARGELTALAMENELVTDG